MGPRSAVMTRNFWLFGGFHEISGLTPVTGLAISEITAGILDFDGLQEISGLTPVMGVAIAGIIINTQVMFLNAWVTFLEVNF